MKRRFKDLPSDCANISAILQYKTKLDVPKNYAHKIKIKPGKYKVILKANDTWNGKISVEGYIETSKEDFLIIGDNAYFIKDDDVDSFMKKYDGGANLFGYGVCLSTGGDGVFTVSVEIISLSKRIPNIYINNLAKANNILKKCKNKTISYDKALEEIKKLKPQNYSEVFDDLSFQIRKLKNDEAMKEIEALLKIKK